MENKTNNLDENVIDRVKQMEQYMDDVLNVLKRYPDAIKEDEAIQIKITELEKYQESGQWIMDYECDERGELPSDLKRGVLSEDLLYNLLCEIRFMRASDKAKVLEETF